MKINSTLPNQRYFIPIESTSPDIYMWRDINSTAIVIRSPDPNPWGKNWDILFSTQYQKGDNSKYPYRIQMRLYLSNTGTPATTERERIKGTIAESNRENMKFIAIPIPTKYTIPEWIVYTIY